MALSLEQLQSELQSGPPAPVYLVLGAGAWARRRAVDSLRRAAVGDDDSPWAVSRGQAGESDLTTLLDGARTLPLGVPRRLVVLRGVEALKAEDLERLADYAGEPSAATCLVLEGEKLGSVAGAARRLRAAARVVECPALRPYEVPRWLAAEIKGHGRRAEPGAVERLQEVLGDDPEALLAGLDKVLTWLGEDKRSLRAEDVSAVLSPVPHGTVWQFIEALEDRRPGPALAALEALLEQGEAPEGILRLMARSRRQLLIGVTARRRGAAPEAVLEAMGVHPKARAAPRIRRAILQRLERHRESELAAAPGRLLAADSDLKGGGPGDARAVLTRLVLDLLGRPGRTGVGPQRRS